MADNIVIAINREYGSGGKTIGEMLSKELGIHYYDKEILHLAADVSGINEALFVVKDEDTTARASLFRAASKVYTGELIAPGSRDFTSEQPGDGFRRVDLEPDREEGGFCYREGV